MQDSPRPKVSYSRWKRGFDEPRVIEEPVLPLEQFMNPFDVAVGRLYDEAQDLLLRKHRNYGPKNIADSPGGAINGLRVRMHDKLARINHMIDNNEPDAVGESLRETFMDIANYGLIAVLVLDGTWPND